VEDRLPRKLAVILHADVAGYSRLAGEDEDTTHRRLKESLGLISQTVISYHGRVINTAGDAVLAMFEAVVDAVSCAAAIQHDLAILNQDIPDERKLLFRIGVNLGDVIADGGDIFGDGVNVAARIEGLAEPGGICIAESVYTALGTKLPVDFEDIGAQSVKNIVEPIRAYQVHLKPGAELPRPSERHKPVGPSKARRWQPITAALVIVLIVAGGGLTWLKPWETKQEPASVERKAVPLPDKPSIAVLPFTNMSGDPDQEYFSDGITEDLTTDLSKISGLFVVARNSSFAYKDTSLDLRQVSRDLGVKYILEGSVRRVGDQIRINAQLINGTTGGHVWAERFDGTMTDVFSLQDEVNQKIIAALAIKLTVDDQERLSQIDTSNPDAYDMLLRGLEQYQRFSLETTAESRDMFKQAIKITGRNRFD
jgi:TolB-like protein/class 3 adenylate cyclase